MFAELHSGAIIMSGHIGKLLLGTTCAVGLSSVPAWPADLPRPLPVKAPAIAPAYVWTGCYVGGSAGGGWGHKEFVDTDFIDPASPAKANTSGALAGGQVGCNYQFASHWLVGIEGSGSWANISGSSDPFFEGKAVFKAKTDWIASTRGRLGYAVDNWLFYASGGAAWAGDRYQMPGTFAGTPFNFTGSETRSGWTIGGGIEWGFWRNWTARLEYAHYDFGTRSVVLVGPALGPLNGLDPSSIKQRIDTVTLGINYRF